VLRECYVQISASPYREFINNVSIIIEIIGAVPQTASKRARPKQDTLWYYRKLAKAFQDFLPGQLAEELMEIVIVLENE
jgi:hypothetical protein